MKGIRIRSKREVEMKGIRIRSKKEGRSRGSGSVQRGGGGYEEFERTLLAGDYVCICGRGGDKEWSVGK